MHQIDRIEDMLVNLTKHLPQQATQVTKLEVASSVVEMFAAIRDGRTIEAIKLYRQLTGWPLKDSKDLICQYVELAKRAA